MEVGQGPNWGCSAKGKKSSNHTANFHIAYLIHSSVQKEISLFY
jgi:hypothetical protein